MARRITTPGIPDIPTGMEQPQRGILEAMKSTIDLREGRLQKVTAAQRNSRFVTIQDLIDAGLVADGVIT